MIYVKALLKCDVCGHEGPGFLRAASVSGGFSPLSFMMSSGTSFDLVYPKPHNEEWSFGSDGILCSKECYDQWQLAVEMKREVKIPFKDFERDPRPPMIPNSLLAMVDQPSKDE